MKNIAILIPITSNKRNWTTFKETDFYSYFLKSFFATYNVEHNYIIYLGIDKDDKLYNQKIIQEEINRFINIMKNASVQFHFFDNLKYKGKPCWIWNELFKIAIKENNDYYVQ